MQIEMCTNKKIEHARPTICLNVQEAHTRPLHCATETLHVLFDIEEHISIVLKVTLSKLNLLLKCRSFLTG